MTFKVGDMVRWTSEAGSISKTKVGEIIEVVPARKWPAMKGCGGWRDHESYVVRVRELHANGNVRSSRLYWPRVGHLERA